MTLSSPAASTAFIQSRRSLLAIAIPHKSRRAMPADGREFPAAGQLLFALLLQLAGTAFALRERRHATW
jgi:hypothetical protein